VKERLKRRLETALAALATSSKIGMGISPLKSAIKESTI
jgi:hypothetical protein